MSAPMIKVEGLGKEYVIGGREKAHATFRDMLSSRLAAPFRRFRNLSGHVEAEERFWALKDVSFEVRAGEVVGIIGRNGAGKSTLLKILSRITAPTEGRVELHGRTASLLEVGTGFHPELTGRENIYLNGAILSMALREIDRKFDQIVDFAEIEKFLDTPVKRYSSGMYIRLAFAVAAHLEPEILIVDEVLAVGDSEFQKKCLGKMQNVAKHGRTILFVSHNLNSVVDLCTTTVLLEHGSVAATGTPREVVTRYLSGSSQDQREWRPEPKPEAAFSFNSVRIIAPSMGDPIPYLEPFEVVFDYTVRADLVPGRLALKLINEHGLRVLASTDTDATSSLNRPWPRGRTVARCAIPGGLLMPGRYQVVFSEPTPSGLDIIREDLLSFTINGIGSPSERDGRGGVVTPILAWRRHQLITASHDEHHEELVKT